MAGIRVEVIDTMGTEICVSSVMKTIPRIGETISLKTIFGSSVSIKEYQVLKVVHSFFVARQFVNECDGITIVVK